MPITGEKRLPPTRMSSQDDVFFGRNKLEAADQKGNELAADQKGIFKARTTLEQGRIEIQLLCPVSELWPS